MKNTATVTHKNERKKKICTHSCTTCMLACTCTRIDYKATIITLPVCKDMS